MIIFPVLLFLARVTHSAPAPNISPDTDVDANFPLWNADSDIIPQPIRGNLGATIIGPKNKAIELQNPDLLAPPTTDNGQVQNMKWPFALSHNRLSNGGWARQQNGAFKIFCTSPNA